MNLLAIVLQWLLGFFRGLGMARPAAILARRDYGLRSPNQAADSQRHASLGWTNVDSVYDQRPVTARWDGTVSAYHERTVRPGG